MDDLRQGAEALYEVFSVYPLKPKIEGCPHCELEAAEESLHTRPLRELAWDDFGVYPFKAMTTFGDAQDFKHFLPRLFELYVLDHPGSHYGPFILFAKLDYADWTTWPTSEADGVRNFVKLWKKFLMSEPGEAEAGNWQLEELQMALREYGFDD
jgi:hypothetical protein